MYADVNRKSLDPEKTHFSHLLHHQGRVLLASELNEHGAIFQYYFRQFIIDFVGAHWRTAGSFEISAVENKNFKISPGHFYVDGILCVNEEVECWYSPKGDATVQPMFPTPEWNEIKDKGLKNGFAVYLECWERHVNLIQRPAIREVALGGHDTSSRLEIAWQVRVLTSDLAATYVADITDALKKRSSKSNKIIQIIEAKFGEFKTGLGDRPVKQNCIETQNFIEILDDASPTLRVWAKKPADASEPCSISPDSQYRGLENQLYRVEIHEPGVVSIDKDSTQPSCKWSRENGSVVFQLIPESLKQSSKEITLDVETLGPDRRYGLCVNDWVELTSDVIEFGQKVLPLAKVEKIDSNLGRLILSINTKTEADFTGCTLLRRWDQKDGSINDDGTVGITEANDDNYDSWIPLEYGIKIQFQPGGNYRKGDYWLIQALVAAGDVEWPKKKDEKGNYVPDARPTDGIKRHRAALAVVMDNKNLLNCGCVLDPICQGK